MPAPIRDYDLSKLKNCLQHFFSARWRVCLVCVLILCSALIYAAYRQQPSPAPAVTAEAQPSQPPAEKAPVQTGESPEKKAARLAATPSIWPAKGTVTSGFGWRISPFGDGNELHPGIDIARGLGTPVVATADGQVVQSGAAGGYGNLVQIDHGNGITTLYGHNSQLAVIAGQTVRKGQVVAYAGSTGKSTGPHVHYEVRENGTAVDPWKYMALY